MRKKAKMNYPGGMTPRDWGRLDGFLHFRDCPAHEDAPYKRLTKCICDELAEADHDAAAEVKWDEERNEGKT